MADLSSILAVLEHDPDDVQALESLAGAIRQAAPDVRTTRLAEARKLLASRGRPDAVVRLLDLELEVAPPERRADMLIEKGMILDADVLDVAGARAAFEQALQLRPDDGMAKEALGELELAASNWQKFADKYVSEASASTDRSLATSLYMSAAETFVKFAPDAPEAEQYLRKALEIDPKNGKAAFHLARLYRRTERWPDLVALYEQRAETAATHDEKIAALLGIARVARAHLGSDGAAKADIAINRVLQLDPAQPQALRAVTDAFAATGNWVSLVGAYQAALKARRDQEDPGILLQIAMVLWKHIGDLDQAEDYFRRLRKTDPAHPAALDFYRVYYPQKGEHQKLLALLRQVEKSPRARSESQRSIGVEIAELAEKQNNPEKAIEAWKQVLRADPNAATSEAGAQARAALGRLYRKTEKWNALLDLMKEEIERIPETDVAGRVGKLHEIVEIYRDKLKLDVMVINTYNAILKIDPDNRRATDELANKFRALGRWNDLIAVLTRKSEVPDVPDAERIALLREIADLWSERFGNFANAIKPLERILELAPGDDNALNRLKDIYTKRRQWRALIDVLGREASVLPDDERRAKQGEMAKLAADRLGDTRLAIEIYNGVLAEAGADHTDTLASLAGLYEREKRWLALAEILHRQVGHAKQRDAIALYEKLGQVYADRLGSPQASADAWQAILDIEPGHAKALRTLRELYATTGDFAGLERLYARLGQADELVDALLAIADRLDAKSARLPLVERAAQLAQQQADAAATGEAPAESAAPQKPRRGRDAGKDSSPGAQALERARQVWERVLAVDPQHRGAASALAPIYARQEKWAKLITVLEIELAAQPDVPSRLAKIGEIRKVCEQKMGSRTLAFTWTLRAFDLDPTSEPLFKDVLRLASEQEQWREAAAVFEKHAKSAQLPEDVRLRLYRELAKIASRRLQDPDRARGYHRQVLALSPEEREAEQHLEELSIQLADWPELLASYRARAAREKDATMRAALLIEIASLQEEKLVDLDGAAATYKEALQAMPGQLRALRSLARIEEARGDWESLATVLAQELDQTPEGQPRFDLLMRLGSLYEVQLDRPNAALVAYRDALGVPAVGGGVRPQATAAITRIVLAPGAKITAEDRVASARLVLPQLIAAKNLNEQARILEVIRTGEATEPGERLQIDRQLMRLYHTDLGDPAAAWDAGVRVLAVAPADAENRAALGVLAGQLGRDGEWAQYLTKALLQVREGAAPQDVRAVATELARVSGERLADKATAERAWLTVLEVEPAAADAFDALAAMYRMDERWGDLRALLERRVEATMDDRVRRAVLLELAALEEDVLQQRELAIEAHRRVLEIDPGYLASYQALDRLYTAGEQWAELEQLLARGTDHAKSPREQVELAYRRAELFAHRLGDPSRAVDLIEDVLARQRGHADARELLEELLPRPEVTLRAARILEPIYESEKLWKDLVGVLRAQRNLATGTEAVELLSRIAAIEEIELGSANNAFAAWSDVLALDPTHERARVELVRLAAQLNRWPEATATLEGAANAVPAGDVSTRAALLGELAGYYDAQLQDSDRAIDVYRRLLDTDAANPAAVRRATAALSRLYEGSRNWPELRAVMRKQAEWSERDDERRTLLVRIAALEEGMLQDREAAIGTWRDILVDHPNDPAALDALERLYQGAERWRELIDILRRKLDHASDEDANTLLGRIAEIHEVMLEEPEEAIAAYLEAVDRDPNNRRAVYELGRLYREAHRNADLLDVLERQAQLDPHAKIDTYIEIARLLAGPLGRPVEALERWHAILEAEPQHPMALQAVEAALGDPELRVQAAEMLRPVYETSGQYDRLAKLQHRAAEWTDDPAAKLRSLGEVVRIREHRLGDKAGAFEAQLQALSFAATEPELPQMVAETERLASELDREAELIDAYRGVASNVLDAEVQRRLYLDIADLARGVRQDTNLAREYYQKVLDQVPDDRRALAALEGIYRDTNDDDRLVEVLLRQADVASTDINDRVGYLVEAANLYVQLRRPDDAILTWEQVLGVAPERRDAVDALEALYREQGRWADVVDLYERRLGFATTIEEAVELRVQLGEIHERHLRDFETAIDNYSAALSGDPRHQTALEAVERYLVDPDLRVVAAEVLEPIYIAQHRWTDLIRVYSARLESAVDPNDRLQLTRFVARLYEDQLEDFEHASHWYAKVFREAPDDEQIRDHLQRLAGIVDNWPFVAQTYQQYLDDETGDSPNVRDVAISIAAIYDRRLGDVDRAYVAYRRALAIPSDDAVPNERELVRRLEEMLGRTQKWPELVQIYDDVIARADDDDLRREALIKRARLLEDGLSDIGRAVDGWREVVHATEGGGTPVVEHAYREAVNELERLYRLREGWRDLVELVESRLARSQNPNETAELRLKLADIFETNLDDLPAAIDQHEQVIQEGRLWERAVAALERLVVHDEHRERIAELLEPVYREQDWWQKLVVILDAKLEYMRDPIDQVQTLHEIAQIHEERDGALDLALEALARAWRIDVAEEGSLDKLLALATKLEAWDDTVQTLEAGAQSASNGDLAASLWARAAEIHEAYRQDLPKAIVAWRKVEEARPDDVVALAALDRLLALEGRVEELVLVVARRAELTDDPGVRLVLLHRVAALYEEVLEDRAKAIEAYRNVLAVDDTDLAALDSLERLYRSAIDAAGGTAPDAARELANTLERKIELTTDVAPRQELRHAVAQVYETQLSDIYQAIGQLTAVLDDDAGEAGALAELDRIYGKEKLWPELLDIIDRRALLATAPEDRANLAYRAAHLVETELHDPEAAIPRYGAVLGVLPSHVQARASLEALLAKDGHVEPVSQILERVYRADRDPAGLARVYERRIASDRGGDHKADWTALADVHETLAGDPGKAFEVWSRAIAATPDDIDLLAPLVRLADADANKPRLWGELATRLDQLLGESLAPDVEQTYAMRLGQIAEEQLNDAERAARAYERASHGPEPKPALTALERVLARSLKWPELATVLRRQADATEDDTQSAEFLYRLGDLQETMLHDPDAAIAAHREVLGLVPTHLQSRAALERMLATTATEGQRELRTQIVEILEPLFEQDNDAPRLVAVLEARLAVTDDPIDRAALLARILELAEQRIGDRARALDAALRWLAVEPSSSQALHEADRLAEQLGQWPEVAARLIAIIAAPDAGSRDPDVQVLLLTYLGKIQRKRLGQLHEAAATYRAALALDPEALIALDDLIEILRQHADQAALAEALRQRGRIVAELPEKRAAFAEVALISERAGDRGAAIAAWREYIDADDNDREALDELAALYRITGDKPALIDTLGHAARLATNGDDEKKLRTEIAQLEDDGPRSIAAWQAVLDLDPDDLHALGALEAAYARSGDWMAVADIQGRRLSLAKTTADRVAIQSDMAKIAEDKRGSIDDAIAAWFGVLDIDNAYVPAYTNLERLLAAAGRWHDLVDLLERYAELQATLGHGTEEIATLARAADVWESQLDNPDAAGEILEKILRREPGSVPALTRLSKIYERAGDWDKCKGTLEQALKLSPIGRDAADLFFRLGEVARVGDADPETAMLHFQQALRHDPGHGAAIAALEKLARERGNTALLADMLQRRVDAIHAPAERVALLVELAELERKAGRNDAALAALARAREDSPDDVRVLAPLADLFFAAGRLDEAAPIYDRLAQDAKAGRRMKDVARFRQRQGGILEARGDRAGALAAYEEALRINPTDVSTMTSLGRIYLATEDWEKARRIYQSLVLQNIDAEAGVTKGEVYWALGKIHLQLGQPPKAKTMFQRGLEIEPHNSKLREALSSMQ
ncbi:MAG TPA: tetratricopeptide repeat protein [Kofleriaceae bacterium]|nr:tetratricopeptide repeat protein [Kofleriaceae bacterium]